MPNISKRMYVCMPGRIYDPIMLMDPKDPYPKRYGSDLNYRIGRALSVGVTSSMR